VVYGFCRPEDRPRPRPPRPADATQPTRRAGRDAGGEDRGRGWSRPQGRSDPTLARASQDGAIALGWCGWPHGMEGACGASRGALAGGEPGGARISPGAGRGGREARAGRGDRPAPGGFLVASWGIPGGSEGRSSRGGGGGEGARGWLVALARVKAWSIATTPRSQARSQSIEESRSDAPQKSRRGQGGPGGRVRCQGGGVVHAGVSPGLGLLERRQV
jgi:hypothetical protein